MVVSRATSRSLAWAVWVIASVFYAYQYILRVMPNIMLEDIMQRFEVGAAAFGQFSGLYYIGYSLMHIPVGLMLDRYGPRYVMTGCILLTVLGVLPLIYSEHWAYPVMGRMLIGIGSSAAILGVFKIVRMTFEESKFSKMLGFSVTIGLLGAIYGGGPLSYMRTLWGYENMVHLFAFMGIGLAIITYFIVPHVKQTSQSTIWSDLQEVLCHKRVWGMCLAAGCMVGPLEGFADVWGRAFLQHVYGFDATLAASLPSLIFIGMCFGGPLLGILTEKFGRATTTMAGIGLTMIASFCCLLLLRLSPSWISLLFIVIGICCAYQILAIATVSGFVREHVMGLTTAVANMIIMMFGYAFHSIMGWIIHDMGGAHNTQALIYGIAVVPVGLCLGTAGMMLLGRKKTQQLPQQEAHV